jgi:RecB family exonuclease
MEVMHKVNSCLERHYTRSHEQTHMMVVHLSQQRTSRAAAAAAAVMTLHMACMY